MREVSTEEAQNLATSWGIEFMEISAMQRINIPECFEAVVRKLRKRTAPKVAEVSNSPPPRGKCIII